MAEDLVEAKKPEGCDADATVIQRRIEFHPVRKLFSPSSNGAFYLETVNPDSETPRPSACNRDPPAVSAPSLGRRSDGVEAYEHEMDPELSFRIRFRKIGAGLANLGNTCFLNSVLQCLTYTEPFAAYLQSGKHKISCQIAGFCAMCAIQNHVMIALQSTGKILSPSTLVKNLRCILICKQNNFTFSCSPSTYNFLLLLKVMNLSLEREGDLKYTLYGVLVHAGWSTESGHYYCYVCTSSGMWHSLDDNQVYQVSEKTVLEQKAYMLFYVRDRSSIVKKSSEMFQKDCVSTSPPGKKLIPHSSLVIKGAVLNCLVDGKLSTLESSSAIPKSYPITDCHPDSGIGTSSDSQLPGVAFLRENDDDIQNEDVAPQSYSQLLGREAALLRANSDILSNVLQQGKKSVDAASSKEFMMPVAQIIQQRLIEDSCEPARDKDFVVMVTQVNDASVTTESDQTNSGKCLLSNDCNEEVKSDMLLSVPNNASCSDSSPQQHHEKILKQINMHENDDVAIAIYQNNDALSKKGTSNVPADKNPLKLLNQSRFMQMAAHDETSVEHQIGNESKRCSTNIQCNGGFLKLEESGMANVLEGCSSGFVEKEVLDIMKSQTGLKPKKHAKHSLNGIYFGRKQLFLSLLSADKIRKRNRRKKRFPIMTSLHKKAVPDDVSMNDQGTSTSETVKNVVLSECAGRKQSCARFKKNRSTRRMRNDSYCCNSESLNISTGGIVGNNGKERTHDHPEQSRWCSSSTDYQCNSGDTILDDRGLLLQRNIMKLLMRGLNQKLLPDGITWNHQSSKYTD
ncbi:ubiquitin carboxyl-terminal hydrolase [Musa troglodytarum]|uniref:Ubiquitin carboxyl-terminal hydrolase n=1 Tax=Musa troglodytarum TaxID=320322 RepID=A0A9E7GCY3_9LILI|nr:ubiquitin carboxyl-terminal hydrolase [Musa troglodytarum]